MVVKQDRLTDRAADHDLPSPVQNHSQVSSHPFSSGTLSSVEGAGMDGHTRVNPKREVSEAPDKALSNLTADEHRRIHPSGRSFPIPPARNRSW